MTPRQLVAALAPPATRRGRLLRLGLRAARFWRRQGTRALVSRSCLAVAHRLAQPEPRGSQEPPLPPPAPGRRRELVRLAHRPAPHRPVTAPVAIDPAALGAVETVGRPLDRVEGGWLEPVLGKPDVPDVVKAYLWRLAEAMPGTAHRRVLPRARVYARLDLLAADPLALAFLHHLLAFRDLEIRFDADDGASPREADATLVADDPAAGRWAIHGDGAETLTFRRTASGATVRRNLGATVREPSWQFLDPEPVPPPSAAPMVSVVMPVYDRTTELLEAIGSVLDQDYPWAELVLVFNGSPPETLALVPAIRRVVKARRYRERVIVLPRAYGAATVPRNIGGFAASGDLIVFLDSDDCLEAPGFFSRAAERVRTAADDCCLFYPGTVEFVNRDRDHWIQGRYRAARPPVCDWETLWQLGSVLNNSGVGIRRSRFLEIGGLDPTMEYCEDYELHMRAVGRRRHGVAVDAGVEIRLHSRNNEIKYEADKQAWMLRARQAAAAFTDAREGSSSPPGG